jgi:hypothetical protein
VAERAVPGAGHGGTFIPADEVIERVLEFLGRRA